MGYKFESKPFQRKVPTPINFNKEQFEIIENEVLDLLSKKAIRVSNYESGQFLSQTYLLLKRRTVNTDLSYT